MCLLKVLQLFHVCIINIKSLNKTLNIIVPFEYKAAPADKVIKTTSSP